jgi:spore germination protein YaaH
MMTWGDSGSVAQKIALAKKLGIRGIAIFKFDGGQDPKIWDVLAGKK